MDKPKKILMGNTTFIRAEYQGDIRISSSTDPSGYATINRVLFTPQMSKNLISVAQMMLNRKTVKFCSEEMICKISEKDKLLALAPT